MPVLFEYATALNHRNMYATPSQFRTIAQQSAGKGQLLRSLFGYEQAELTAHLRAQGSIAKFDGMIHPSHIFVDVDGHGMTDAQLIKRIEQANSALHVTNSIPPECCQYFFTGRGFHIMMHQGMFKLMPSLLLHRVVKNIVWDLLIGHDWLDDIYSKSHLIRWTNHVNEKTGFIKIPLSYGEICNLNDEKLNELKGLAAAPRLDFDYSVFAESGELHNLGDLTRHAEGTASSLLATNRAAGDRVEQDNPMAQNRRKITCVHEMMAVPPQANRRHTTIGAVSCALRRQGVPIQICIDGLIQWIRQADRYIADNAKVYTDEHVISQVKHWYEKGYAPSCTGNNKYSALMQHHCSPECMFFNKKNINSGITNSDDAMVLLKQRMEWIRTGNFIDLGLIFGGTKGKLRAFPGNVVILFGDTGIGKTKIMQWLILQIKRAVFWLSLEMDIGSMTERFAQQLLGCDEETLAVKILEYEDSIVRAISNIYQTTESLSIQEILDIASAQNINTIVIDHLGLLTSRYERDQRLHVGSLMKEMRAAARSKGLLFLALSHISRGAAMAGKLNVHSGLDSGSVERDAHIVMSLEVLTDTTMKVTVQKQTHGPSGMEYVLAIDKDTNMFYNIHDPMFDIASGVVKR